MISNKKPHISPFPLKKRNMIKQSFFLLSFFQCGPLFAAAFVGLVVISKGRVSAQDRSGRR